MKKAFSVFVAMLLFVTGGVYAQDDTTVTVPDVTGLSLPVATAELNRAGLRVGTQNALPWTEDSGLPEDAIAEQSVAPGETVPFGTAVDLTLLRSNNALLIYDDNDITLVNQSGGTINLSNLTFNAAGSDAAFNAGDWAGTLQAGDCAQLWSVARTGPKDVPECQENTVWLTTNNPARHFWTGTDGSTTFTADQGGLERATCDVSATGRCELFLDSSGLANVLNYVYFAYTDTQWVVFNNSEDQWMSLAGVLFSNAEGTPGGEISPAETADNPETVLGSTTLLAPQQCVLVRTADAPETLPLECDPMATFTLDAPTWTSTLFVTSVSDGEQRACPPATPGRLTLCILPR